MVSEKVSLIVEPSSETGLATQLKELKPVQFTPCTGSSVVIIYDCKQSGESMSRPALRHPPLRRMHVRKTIGAVLQARGGKQGIWENDVFVLMDAHRHGNENDLCSGFLNSEGKLMTTVGRICKRC
jgi:hypothetical protein